MYRYIIIYILYYVCYDVYGTFSIVERRGNVMAVLQNLIGSSDKLKAFEVDQLVSASDAVRKFSKIRTEAKVKPKLILESNKADSVLVSIEYYEQLVDRIELWETRIFELEAEIRQLEIKTGDVQPVTAEKLFNSKEKNEIKAAVAIDISDDDLFA